jgi:sugar/nucleoside kinase (ribokinase family)
VQGFVRIVGEGEVLRYAPWPERCEALPLIDVLKTDAVEAEFLTGRAEIREAARALADEGAKEIVITHKDGLLVFADGAFHEAPFRPEALRGRSGRGDTCVGAYLSKRLTSPPERATRWAAALTSLKLEAEGPITRSSDEVESLLRSAYSS